MTVTAALLLASELMKLVTVAVDSQSDEIKLEDIGRDSENAVDELKAYLEAKGD